MNTKVKDLETYQATEEFIHELRGAVNDVHFDRMTRLLYSTDASIYQMIPVGVALPRNPDEVSAAVEIAGRHRVPVLPRGSGSSLAGQAVGHALILDLSRHMNRIMEIDPERKIIRTQPGVTGSVLNRSLRPYGLMYGPDPASADRATMGGILGNNSTGAHSIVYGMTDQHVDSTDVVLSDASMVRFDRFEGDGWEARGKRSGLEGAIYRSIGGILERYAEQIAVGYPKTFRTVAGYNLNLIARDERPNLARLMVGSEGTLGVITEMTLHVVPIPKVKRLAMVHFTELKAAMEAVPALLGTHPSAVEVLDKMMLDLARGRHEYRNLLTFVEGDPEIVLLVEYSGNHARDLAAGIEKLKNTLRKIGHTEPIIEVDDPTEQANVWYVRKVGLGILMSVRGDAKPIPFIEDAAVPVDHLAEYVTQIYEYAYSTGIENVAMYAHASAGCLHIRPLVNLKSPDGVRQLRQVAEKSTELVTRFGGTTSGEHGEGIARAEFSQNLFGPELLGAFQELKDAFDPNNLMNPGKVVQPPRMDSEVLLRFGSGYAVPYEPIDTIFSFREDHGFAGAVEMCNGAGVCRKLGEGVMCPSFQVTQDEAYSTRGRANALRAAMMGLLGPAGMTSQELYDIFDLCISCHACKSECPSSVDMAKLKAEFLHGYYKKHGVPLRSRVFANIDSLNRLAQPVAQIINPLLDGPAKWALTKLDIHPARSLPKYAPETFENWFRRHKAQNGRYNKPGAKQVVFFNDTFMEYNQPEIGKAAIEVLEAAGIEPIVLFEKKCCGRPAVSKGLLEDARKHAEHNIRLLAPYAKRGIPIVGCEPSCMSMMVDEYPDLVPGEDADVVAKMTMLLEAFLVHEYDGGRLDHLEFYDAPRSVLFHGQCTQKAIFGTDSTLKFLSIIPNCKVVLIESSCCGMAGSFGYEKEHYELSMKLAELSLAPTIRSAPMGTIISASGVSCREQIRHTTDRHALHPIEIFADALRTEDRWGF
jgi:FAD/FMN-containing dehydrogenase/Fe-S oxidoreductase